MRVHRKNGKLDLLRYVCAHDVGMIVNPDTLRHVIDRQLVYGTSRALFEEVRFDDKMVTSVDWATYPVLGRAAPLRLAGAAVIRRRNAP